MDSSDTQEPNKKVCRCDDPILAAESQTGYDGKKEEEGRERALQATIKAGDELDKPLDSMLPKCTTSHTFFEFTCGDGSTVSTPKATFGTFKLQGDECVKVMRDAISVGYRRFDTASVYRNEVEVGTAIRESGIPRGEFFVTTKLHPKTMKSSEKVAAAIVASCKALDIGYIDLFLIHWPAASGIPSHSERHALLRKQTWETLARAVHGEIEGAIVRSVGVSNFKVSHLELMKEQRLFDLCPCSVNQVEYHPLIDNSTLFNWCLNTGIVIEAYSPLGCGDPLLLDHESVLRVASKYNCTPAELILSWILKRGAIPVCKTSNWKRMESNFACVQKPISLEHCDMEELNKLGEVNHHFCWNPDRVR